ncbi:MAG: aminotransferase class V-fold PLP-dependent enzyme, partial [Gemmatimonadota bacterium]|nr:aminotransferase class V-fold PLP-dependent enzyme [Gemmatimonadota bacterium]
RVAAYYRVGEGYTNLEAGYFGMMAAPVLAAYHGHIDRVNRDSSYYARRDYGADFEAVRERVARLLGARPPEIALTRGATEALQRLIIQYRHLAPGDAVIYADLDYGAMQLAMNALAQQRGASVVKLEIPEPATRANVLDAYARILEATPSARLLLLTHLNNKTGLIIPVQEIVALARARGVDTVVDAAHSFGQCDLTLDDLGADFVGLNLHKWLGAPVGAGVMYIKGSRLGDIDVMLGDDGPADRIESRMHTGTANFATFLTVPAALDFHDAVGAPHKAARVRYLRDRWVTAVRGTRGIDVLTPDDHDLVAAITSFRLGGRTGTEENQAIVRDLLERYGLFTVWRNGVARGDCVRVTPSVYNTPADLDRLAEALRALAARA